jgi:hypothetical protein
LVVIQRSRRGGSDAVVDPDLRLNGFNNIYVVDASVMATIPSGPVNAAVVAIAETWAVSSPVTASAKPSHSHVIAADRRTARWATFRRQNSVLGVTCVFDEKENCSAKAQMFSSERHELSRDKLIYT